MAIDPETGALIVPASLAVTNAMPADMVLSPDGLTLYVVEHDGLLRAYNAETGALIDSWDVAIEAGAIDVSADGRRIAIVENYYEYSERPIVKVRLFDLQTEAVKTFSLKSEPNALHFSDVAFLGDDSILLTQRYNGSGYEVPLRRLDPATGQFTKTDLANSAGVLVRGGDWGSVLMGAGYAGVAAARYSADAGVVAEDGYFGMIFGSIAYSGAGGLVAGIDYGGGIFIYDAALELKKQLFNRQPDLHGITFSADGTALFYVDQDTDKIVQLSTANWSEVRSFSIGTDVRSFSGGGFGNFLLAGPDERFFMVYTNEGIRRVDNPAVADALVGTEAGDTITGSDASDTLIGFGGEDALDGGLGGDSMIGGDGDDTYRVAQAADEIVEKAGEGRDTVLASVSYVIADNVETLILTGNASINGTGNGRANILTGNAAANRLDGGGGADTMRGGLGSDSYVVDSSGDKAVELAGAGIDRVDAKSSYTLGANVENLTLLLGATAGTGNELANRILGNKGNNILDGRGGADAMAGGKGNDVYVIDVAGDSIVEKAGEGIDTVKTSFTYTLAAELENLTLGGTAPAEGTGNAAANVLLGNAAGNILRGLDGADVLNGKAGADTLKGGRGDDRYFIDNAADAVIEAAGSGVDTVSSSISFTLTGSLEHLELVGTDAIGGTGNGTGNRLIGNDAANRLDGAGGGDIIVGNRGADEIFGGNGMDVVDGGKGADRIHGGVGNDRLAGGPGPDEFYFDTALNGFANVDAIVDFTAAADRIFLDAAIFAGLAEGTLGDAAFALGAGAQDADDRIIYDPSIGHIFYDADGSDSAAAVLFAQVAVGTSVAAADFVIYG